MINTMISIPVHEKTEVVIDQIVNCKHFFPNCGVVLHISKGFNYEDSFHTEKEFMFILSTFENVFVNPTHLDTGFADIVQTHVSNFNYIANLVDFEYFAMEASNDLFVRQMPEIKDRDANFYRNIWEKHDTWNKYWRIPLINDKYLNDILNYFKKDRSVLICSQIEGSYYKKELFAKIVELIDRFYNYKEVIKQPRTTYPREEVFYSTLATLLDENLNNLQNPYTFVPWSTPGYLPSEEEINDVSNAKKEGKYSIKRVLRNINDPVRFMIGTQIGQYRNKSMDCIKIKFGKISRNLFNLVSGRRRIFIGHAENEVNIRKFFKLKTIEKYIPFKVTNNTINLAEILNIMSNNRDALFIIFTDIYPHLLNILLQQGFRENIDFIDGSLLLD